MPTVHLTRRWLAGRRAPEIPRDDHPVLACIAVSRYRFESHPFVRADGNVVTSGNLGDAEVISPGGRVSKLTVQPRQETLATVVPIDADLPADDEAVARERLSPINA